MNKTVEYVEKNIYEQLNLKIIADNVYISKYHLHRVFKSVTGLSLMDYVRSRKLLLSTQELLHTSLRISDIAQEYGFSYTQIYINAFQKKMVFLQKSFRILANVNSYS